MAKPRVREADRAEARALIVKWQRIEHPNHTGPALFDCERRQLVELIASALARRQHEASHTA